MQTKYHLQKILRSALFLGLFILLILLFVGAGLAAVKLASGRNQAPDIIPGTADVPDSDDQTADPAASTLRINSQLDVAGQFYLAPSVLPSDARAGTIAFDQLTGSFGYFDGRGFVPLAGMDRIDEILSQLQQVQAQIPEQIQLPAMVTSLQGQSGAITLTPGPGIVINGTTISNSGLLGISGVPGDINVTTANGIATITLPQALGQTATPTFANINLGSPLGTAQGGTGTTGLTQNAVVIGGGAGPLTAVSAAGPGLCLLSTVGAPSFGICSGSTAGVASVNGLSGVLTLANSVGIGDTITIDDASTTGKGIAQFDADNFSVVNGLVSTVQDIHVSASPTFAGLTLSAPLAVSSGGTGANAFASNAVLIGNGASPVQSVSSGAPGECLVSTSGAPIFTTCPGSGGVATLNGQTGALVLDNASASGGVITIDDASTSEKGIAQFNSNNFVVLSGVVNTIQGIATTDSPTFAGLTLSAPLAVSSGGTGATDAAGARANLGAAAAGANTDITSTSNLNTITPSGTLTVGSAVESFVLQGTSASAITASDGGNTTTLGFATPMASTVINLPALAAGTYEICTSANNCASTGVSSLNTFVGAVTIQGTTNQVLVDNSSGTITLSTPQDINTGASPTFAGLTLSAPLSVSSGGTGASTFTPNAVLIGNGTGAVQVVSAGGAGQCLVSTVGAPVFAACPGGGGVTSVNGETGALIVANASGSGGTITIDDASTSSKGIAQFNSQNFTVSGGIVNTIQGISSTDSPIFDGLTLDSLTVNGDTITDFTGTGLTLNNGALEVTLGTTVDLGLEVTGILPVANGGTGADNAADARTNLGAAASGANSDITSLSGLTTALSIAQGGTGATTFQGAINNLSGLTTNGDILYFDGSNTTRLPRGSNGQCLISNASTILWDTCTGDGVGIASLTLQGSSGTPQSLGDGDTITIAAGTNIETIAGATDTITVNVVNNPTFSGLVTLQGGAAVSPGQNFTINGEAFTDLTGDGLYFSGGSLNVTLGTTVDLTSEVSGILPVSSGGTGTTTLSQYGVLVGNGTGAITSIVAGSSGLCLTSNAGAAPSWQSCPGSAGSVASINMLDGAITLQGTTDQIVVTDDGVNVITISTPQDIAVTSSPTFMNLTLNGDLTVNGDTITDFVGSGLQLSGGVLQTTLGDSVDLTLEVTGILPVANGGIGADNATDARANLGAAASGANSDITSLSGLTTALSIAQGGTGATTFQGAINNLSGLTTNGDILYFDGTNATRLPRGNNGECLISSATSILWDTCTGDGVGIASLTLQGSSGTPQTLSDGDTITIAAGTNIETVAGATDTIVVNVINNPSFSGLVSLQGGATVSPGQNFTINGEAFTDLTGDGLYFSGGSLNVTLGTSVDLASEVIGMLPVSNGGTGATTLSQYGVLIGNGTGAITSVVAGSAGLCLTSNSGAAPSWESCPGAGASVTSLNTLSGALTLQGTANQVAVTDDGVNAITISLPQDIATSSSPTFMDLSLDGELVVGGDTITDFTGTGLTLNSGVLEVSLGTSIDLTLEVTGILPVANGGTGADNAAGARSNLGAAASGANSDITSLSGLTTALSIAQGGTGATTFQGAINNLSGLTTNGDILYFDGSNATRLARGNDGECLLSSSTTILWGTCTGDGVGIASLTLQGSSGTPQTIGDGDTITIAAGTNIETIANATDTVTVSVINNPTFTGLVSLQGGATVSPGQNFTINGEAFTDLTGDGLYFSGGLLNVTLGTSIDLTSEVSGTLSVSSGGTGAVSLSQHGVLIGNGTGAITSVVAGSAGLCLVSNAGAAPSWQSCPGSAGNVASLNLLDGALTIQGTSNQVAVSDNGVNTITISLPQDIAAASSPTFANLTLNGDLSVNGDTISDFVGTGLQLNAGVLEVALGTSVDLTLEVTGILPVANGGTGADNAADARTNLGAAASGTNGDITSTTALNTITPSGALTVGAAGQAFTLQGTASSVMTATSGANVTTIGFSAPIASATINFPALGAGTYEFCTTSGNCLGGGGGANTSLSNLSSVAINTSLLPGSSTIDLGSAVSPFHYLYIGGTTTNNFQLSGTATAPRSISFPDASGEVCLDTGNCIGGGGGAPSSASYLTLSSDGALGAERVLTSGLNMAFTDGGANSTLTIGTVSNPTFSTSVTTPLLTSTGAMAITPGGSLTIGATGQAFAMQGTNASVITAQNGSFTTTVGFVNPTANATINFPALPAGIYTVCTSDNNCANTGVTSVNTFTGGVTVQGTANQILINNNSGVITLSTPQDINTSSSPTFNGLTLSSLTLGADTVTDLTGTGLQVTGGVLSTTLGTTVDLAAEVTGTLPVANGGTGATSLGANGVLVGNGTGAISSVTAGSAGLCLISTAGTPSWQACPGSAGSVASINGLDGALNLQGTTDQIIVTDDGVNTFTLSLPQGINTTSSPTFAGITLTSVTVGSDTVNDLTGSGLTIVSGVLQTTLGTTVDLAAEVTGTLPIGNGGTGSTTQQGAINALSGLTTNGDLLYHNGTNATRLPRGTNGQCLLSNATTVLWGTCPADGVGISSLGGQTGASQTFGNDTNITMSSAANVHTLGWTGTLSVARGGTGSSTASGARTNLGATTVGANFFTLTNPSAVTFARINADNTVSALSASAFRTAIGAGTGDGSVTSVNVSGGTTGLTTSGGPITTSGTITLGGTLAVANGGTGQSTLNDLIQLGAHTTGDYVTAVSAGTGVAVTGSAGEGWTPMVALDYTATLAANPALAAGQSSFASTGLIFEGATANNFETLLTVTDPSADRTITLPDVSGTVITTGNLGQITATGTITAGVWNGTAVGIAYGGTGSTTQQGAINALSGLTTNGDLLYHNGTNATRLPRGTNGQCLLSNATTVLWGTCPADGVGISSLGGQTGGTQTFANDTNVTISSAANVHTLGWTGTLSVARGGTGANDASGARTNLGATTVGANFFTLTNPSAVRFARVNADNTVSLLDAAAFRTAIGAGTGNGTVTSINISGGTTGLSASGGPVTTSGTITLGGTLAIANGGTGATTAQGAINNLAGLTTQGDLLYHNGTNTTRLPRGTNGQCLMSDASTILWGACPADGVGISSLNSQTGGTQTFANDTNITISSAANVHTLGWTGTLSVARGGTGASDASGARTNLGATTVGANFFTLTNPSAIRFARVNSDNTVSLLDAAAFRTAIGAGTGNGTVTSVNVSGGTTGLSTSGGPVTGSGTITLSGTLGLANGGTNATTAQGAINNLAGLTTQGDLLYHDGTNATRLPRGTNGQCLMSSATTILWNNCPGDGVGIAGLTLAGSSGTPQALGNGDTITLAAGSNITTTAGATDTVTIAVSSSPSFSGTLTVAGLTTLNGGLTLEVGDTFTFNGDAFTDLTGTGLTIVGGALQTTLGTSVDLTSEVTGILPVANGGTGANNAASARSNLGAAASGSNGDITATTALNTITPSGALTVGASNQAFTLQGSGASTITATATGFTTTLSFLAPTANTTLRLPALSAGTYDICTSGGNCVGAGGSAPAGASYLTLGFTADLSNERVLQAGTNISFVDAGANGNLTVSTVSNPTFTTSVTTPQVQSTGALNIVPGGTLTAGSTAQPTVLQGTSVGITSNSAGADITLTSADQIILNAGTTIELQDNVNVTGNLVVSGTVQGTRLISTVATGTAPLQVASTTLVSNFNADLLDGQDGSHYLALANATGTLAIANGGTGATSAATALSNLGGVPTSRTLTFTTNNGLTGGAAALNLSANRSWTFGLTGQALALHNLNTSGLIARTAANTLAARTITGTTNLITVTNGNGVSGNPTITVGSNVVQTARNLTAGDGLTGGGTLAANRTFHVGAGSCISVAANSVAVDSGCGSFIRNQTSVWQSANFSITGYMATQSVGLASGGFHLPSGSPSYSSAAQVCFGGPVTYLSSTWHRLGSCAASSARYKNNVQNLLGGINDIRQLRPVTFYYNEDYAPDVPDKQVGFIAEEVAAINPLFAVYKDGQVDSVRYDKLTALLALGVQQLDLQVQNHGSRLGSAENRLAVLENKTAWVNLQVTGTATINNLKVTGLTEVASIKVNGKIISAGSPATAVLGAQAAAGGSITITGNDTAGTISYVSLGGTPGEQAKVTFASAYASQPRVALTPKNAGSAEARYFVITTTTGFTVHFLDAPAAGATYNFDYILIQ